MVVAPPLPTKEKMHVEILAYLIYKNILALKASESNKKK